MRFTDSYGMWPDWVNYNGAIDKAKSAVKSYVENAVLNVYYAAKKAVKDLVSRIETTLIKMGIM